MPAGPEEDPESDGACAAAAADPLGDDSLAAELAAIKPTYPVTYQETHLEGIGPIQVVVPDYLESSECKYHYLLDHSIYETLEQRGFEASGLDAFSSMIQGEEASHYLTIMKGLSPFMPFPRPIRLDLKEGDDLEKLGFVGHFIKDNPDRACQVALYYQYWNLMSPEHIWVIFHRKARADDPVKSLEDMKFILSEERVENFKKALPYLDEVYFRAQNIAFGQWHDLLNGHPLAVYFGYLIANKIGAMSDDYAERNALMILDENLGQFDALVTKAELIKFGKILKMRKDEIKLELSIKLYQKALEIEKNPEVFGGLVDVIRLFKSDQFQLNSDFFDLKKRMFLSAHECAANGFPGGQCVLGEIYRDRKLSDGFQLSEKQRTRKSTMYFAQAAYQGNIRAKKHLINMYLDGKIGRWGDDINYEEVGKRCLELAREGDLQCQMKYAVLLEKGKINLHLTKDEREIKAAYWYWQAGKQRDFPSFSKFVSLYQLNPSVKDYVLEKLPLKLGEDVTDWLLEMYKQQEDKFDELKVLRTIFSLHSIGKVDASKFIQDHYMRHKEFLREEKSLDAILILIDHAVILENPKAMHNLGMIFYKKGDLVTAQIWFGEAASRGLAASERNLQRVAEALKKKPAKQGMRVSYEMGESKLAIHYNGSRVCTGDALEKYKDMSELDLLKFLIFDNQLGCSISYDCLDKPPTLESFISIIQEYERTRDT
tara:strand:+ start:4392 stop:6530 length:2139 start_codon:yes stop_codon:yes gene_type:complete